MRDVPTSPDSLHSYSWNYSYSWYYTTESAMHAEPLHPSAKPILGVVTILIVTFGAPANIVSFMYFMKRSSKNASTVIYRLMNIVDLTICILLIPIGINYFNPNRSKDPYVFNVTILCNIWSILWNISIRLSIYLIGIMSTARAVSLFRPLYLLRRRSVALPFIIYTVFLLIQQTLPYWFGNHVRYFNLMGICTWTFSSIVPIFSMEHKICDFFFIQLEFLIPVLPIFVSSAVSIAKLLEKRQVTGQEGSDKNRKHATTTIIILTVVFVLLNAPFLVYQFIMSVATYSDGKIQLQWDHSIPINARKILSHIYNIHLIGLNSCVNPIIYFIRIKELRSHVLSSATRKNTIIRRQSLSKRLTKPIILLSRPTCKMTTYQIIRPALSVCNDVASNRALVETEAIRLENGYTLLEQEEQCGYQVRFETSC